MTTYSVIKLGDAWVSDGQRHPPGITFRDVHVNGVGYPPITWSMAVQRLFEEIVTPMVTQFITEGGSVTIRVEVNKANLQPQQPIILEPA